jgi:hypothetical protein
MGVSGLLEASTASGRCRQPLKLISQLAVHWISFDKPTGQGLQFMWAELPDKPGSCISSDGVCPLDCEGYGSGLTRQYLTCSIITNTFRFHVKYSPPRTNGCKVQGIIPHPPSDGRHKVFDSFVQRKLELDSGEKGILVTAYYPPMYLFMLRDLVYHDPVMSDPSPGELG